MNFKYKNKKGEEYGMIDYEILQNKTINDFRAINMDALRIIQSCKRDVSEEKIALLLQYFYYWKDRSSHRHKKERLINLSEKDMKNKIGILSPDQIKRGRKFLLNNNAIYIKKRTYSKDKRKNSYLLNEENEMVKACKSGNIKMLYSFSYDYFKDNFSGVDYLSSAIVLHHLLFWANRAEHSYNNKKWFNKSARELSEELPWMRQKKIYSILHNIVKDEMFLAMEGLYGNNLFKLSYTPNTNHPLVRQILITDKLRKEYKKTLKEKPQYNGFEMFIETCQDFSYLSELNNYFDSQQIQELR